MEAIAIWILMALMLALAGGALGSAEFVARYPDKPRPTAKEEIGAGCIVTGLGVGAILLLLLASVVM